MERTFHGSSRPSGKRKGNPMEMIVLILIPLTFVIAFALERLFPARPLPAVKWWAVKGFLFFFITGTLNAFVPAIVAELVTGAATPFDLTALGLIPGAALVMLASDAVSYWVHRFLHRVDFVWRWTHQMHHSAERLDIPGAVYFHPFDIALQAGVPTLLVALLGVTPDAAALAGYCLFALAMFQHLNVKTPRWLGYIVLRPEQHSVHHARGVHAYNYGNFAFMDLLFGTFRNPEKFSVEQGFWDGASAKVGAMLVGRDVGQREEVVREVRTLRSAVA
jgi:sterol desaturase/sphingolipid hydroxylase (fatty acid hydroxylase superfamily)